MSLFGENTIVTEEDMAPPVFENITSGNYRMTFSSPEVKSNDFGWEGIAFTNVINAAEDGSETKFGGRSVDGMVSTKQATQTKEGKPKDFNPEGAKRDAATVARLLKALGVATVDDDGNVDLSGLSSTQDVLDLLEAADGTEYLGYVKTGPRKRGGQVQTKDDGTPWIDSQVRGFQPLG